MGNTEEFVRVNLVRRERFVSGSARSKVAVEDDRMRTSEVLALAVAAAILTIVAVVIYSLVAQKMYAKDKEVAKHHREPAAQEETPDNPK